MFKVLQLRQQTPCRLRTTNEIIAQILRFEPDVADTRLIAHQHPRFIADIFRTDVLVRLLGTRYRRDMDSALVSECASPDKGGAFVRNEIRNFINVPARMRE